jgi:Ca2+-binding RTX toxin-like protein
VFNAVLNPGTNRDTIADFAPLGDTLHLDDDVFTALSIGALEALQFYAAAGATAAHDADDRIVYDPSTGALYYDRDGTSGAASVQFAVLSTKPTLTAEDFTIVA